MTADLAGTGDGAKEHNLANMPLVLHMVVFGGVFSGSKVDLGSVMVHKKTFLMSSLIILLDHNSLDILCAGVSLGLRFLCVQSKAPL